ncbi:uncharacterized protein LOC120200819 [Hibiscus syriacus]|uniref:uncharacterized protein LOC120200819 n=1 Tax=Hibiscus syriacus TaxID=106335 RepID=UPI0019212280|nr:uncharacterized protein LOC120200819 [Hibiscus syriacus]
MYKTKQLWSPLSAAFRRLLPTTCRLAPFSANSKIPSLSSHLRSSSRAPLRPEIFPDSKISLLSFCSQSAANLDSTTKPCWNCIANAPGSTPFLYCDSCRSIQPVDLSIDYFQIFGLEKKHEIEVDGLERRYKDWQKKLHPDIVHSKSEKEREYAAEQSGRVIDVYRTLSKPLSRAVYIGISTSRKLLAGELPSYQRLWRSPSASISTPLYQYFQQSGISTSRELLAGSSEETAIASPLTPVLAINSGKTEEKKVAPNRTKVQAVLKKIKQSPKKVNLVAALVRGMRVEDALLQLQVTVKRAAETVYQVIHSAKANATHNHGLVPERLLVEEAFVGKGLFLKRVSYHGKGRSGIREKPECRLTIVVRETTPEEEAEIARLRVRKFRKLTKREKRLVPHELIETTPIWNRKGSNREPNGRAA